MLKIIAVAGVLSASLFGSIGALYLKRASRNFKFNLKSVFEMKLILGLIFYFVSAGIVIFLLKNNDMSYIYPLTALTYVFVIILSWKYLNETINIYKIASVLLIITGVALILAS